MPILRTEYLLNEKAMIALGADIAAHLKAGQVIFLQGQLGAGKTTLVRAMLRALGWTDIVKSPTYTLVESYCFKQFQLHHFDLYRLQDPWELEYLGIQDYLNPNSVCLFEWPEKAANLLPKPDLIFKIAVVNSGRSIEIVGSENQ